MKLKNSLMFVACSICAILCFSGCNSKVKEEKPKEETKGKCVITDCMKQIETSNSIEEINNIIGFEGDKNSSGDEYKWKLDSNNIITIKYYSSGSPTLQATIDKDLVKNDNVKLPTSSELKQQLKSGSFTYQELVEKVGGVEGTIAGKTNSSVRYIWVDKSSMRLSATFDNKTGKCSIVSFS